MIDDSATSKIPERQEIPKEMRWDLSKIYNSNDDWEREFASIDSLVETFTEFKGRIAQSPDLLRQTLETLDEMQRVVYKVYTYAHLNSDEDIANVENRGRVDKTSVKLAEINGCTAWLEPAILEIPDEKMELFLASDELKFYNRSLKELLRNRQHTLSEAEERILGLTADLMASPHKIFSLLSNADMRFPEVADDKRILTELTHSNFIKFLENPERSVRKDAFKTMYETLDKYKNTFSATLDTSVKTDVLKASLRGFESALQGALYPDNIPREVYDNLITTVHAGLPSLHKYMKLRSKVLKCDKLDMYDIYNPLIPECNTEVEWEQAMCWVADSLAPMGEAYMHTLKKAFSERWIDVLPCRGKRSGAYSSGCYDSAPYVLLNYTGTLNDVFTLAHELGHSMHTYYSSKTQQYHYADYRIFVAEVASTTNELLLHHHLMQQNTDPNFKNYLLNHLIDQIRGTVYRQTMFAEFEKMIHEEAGRGVPLTHEALSESYYELNRQYHGNGVDADRLIGMEWARIPHFYYNFYVYKYATGFSAAVVLSKNILSGDKDKLDAYMGFLKAGDTKDVLDILKDAGVDLSTPEPIKNTLALFEKSVEELESNLLAGV